MPALFPISYNFPQDNKISHNLNECLKTSLPVWFDKLILQLLLFLLADDKMSADLWLLNSCTVKNPSEDHFRNEIEEACRLNKHVVLAGCVPQGQPKTSYLQVIGCNNHIMILAINSLRPFQGFSIVGVQQIDRIVEVVEETLKGL